MPITVYNTLTRKLESFRPMVDGEVRMYTCGPTVYDYFHIGNARTFVMSDVIRRYLQYRGYHVTYVMNITDIDDRIIARSIERSVAASQVSDEYAAAFLEDCAAIGIRPADVHPRATDNVGAIITHIQSLIDTGSAYECEGDVYFRVSAFPGYGKLSGKKLEDLIAGARVEADTRKENPADFALWKTAKPGEPWWDSPWGKGRPGWHIECSVMSMQHLGPSFDIHAGGNDLIFPHHENEIAQSEALTHVPLAHTWIHFGFLNIDNEKMSKSLGNFFTTREILQKYPATTVRFFYLQTQYRSPLNFTQEGLDAARTGLARLHTLYAALRNAPDGSGECAIGPYEERFIEAVDNDFNTPAGLAVIFDFAREANAVLHDAEGMSREAQQACSDFLTRTAGDVFGILPSDDVTADGSGDVHGLMELILGIRAKVRAEKQWALADYIRDGLKELGIVVEDGKGGSTWKKETP
ncbi:MAG: cysteine--tRNA ligase [Ignavibacteriae bacterium]|nr:cysteine--tRNA ligase [Ignavibacteriota bacterium]